MIFKTIDKNNSIRVPNNILLLGLFSFYESTSRFHIELRLQPNTNLGYEKNIPKEIGDGLVDEMASCVV